MNYYDARYLLRLLNRLGIRTTADTAAAEDTHIIYDMNFVEWLSWHDLIYGGMRSRPEDSVEDDR